MENPDLDLEPLLVITAEDLGDLVCPPDFYVNSFQEWLAKVYYHAMFGETNDMYEMLSNLRIDQNYTIKLKATRECPCGTFFESPDQELFGMVTEDIRKSFHMVMVYLIFGECQCVSEEEPSEIVESSINLIHVAASCNQVALVKEMINRGADINIKTGSLFVSPLQLAISGVVRELPKISSKMCPESACFEMVHLLVENGAYINYACNHMHNSAFLAMDEQYYTVVEYLIKKGLKLNETNNSNETLLGKAILAYQPALVDLMISHGVDINHQSKFQLPLNMAISKGCDDIVRALLCGNIDLKSTDSGGFSLHIAVLKHRLDIVELLVDAGVDIDYPDAHGYTSLMIAAHENVIDIVRFLLDKSCNVDVVDNTGYAALHLAAWCGNVDIVELLLSVECSFDSLTEDKNTPLSLACHGNHLSSFEKLLQFNCNINNADKDLDTPLHYATYNGCINTVKHLLEKGARVNVKNSVGCTPFWNSVQMKHIDIAKLLLENNATVDDVSVGIDQWVNSNVVIKVYDSGKSPLRIASYHGLFETVKLIAQIETNVSSENWIWTSHESEEHIISWLRDYASRAPSLLLLCRYFLRSYFRSCNIPLTAVTHLPLPDIVIGFILLKK